MLSAHHNETKSNETIPQHHSHFNHSGGHQSLTHLKTKDFDDIDDYFDDSDEEDDSIVIGDQKLDGA